MFRFIDMESVGNIVTLPHSTEDKNSDMATHQLIQEMFKDAAKLEEERMDKFLADAEELHKNNEKEIVGLLKVMVDNSRANSVWETVEMIDEAGVDCRLAWCPGVFHLTLCDYVSLLVAFAADMRECTFFSFAPFA